MNTYLTICSSVLVEYQLLFDFDAGYDFRRVFILVP